MATQVIPTAASFVCNECHGSFPSQATLAQHLLEHNMLRTLKASQAVPQKEASSIKPPSASPPPILTGWMPGVVDHFNEVKGFGFLRRTTPGAHAGSVFFHINNCNIKTPSPKCGECVTFKEGVGAKGPIAISMMRGTMPPVVAPPPVSLPTVTGLVQGLVTVYECLGGFGTITTWNGTALYFSIAACDVKKPPLVPGERVLVAETVGPKGPTASVVKRIAIPADTPPKNHTAAASAKKKPGKKSKPSLPSTEASIMSALTRALGMVVTGTNSVSAVGQVPPTKEMAPMVAPPQPAKVVETIQAPLRSQQYEDILRLLSSADVGNLYIPSGLSMLARTQPTEAESIGTLDAQTQLSMLQIALRDECESAHLRELTEWAADSAAVLDFGYMAPPSPVAAALPRRATPPPPTPAPPQTVFCGICQDEDPIEDIFYTSECQHAYCRESIRNFVLSKMREKIVNPICPHDGCGNLFSDVDVIQVLTPEEQQEYYNMSMDLAARDVPGIFHCLQPDCRGFGGLDGDVHFVCPLCRAERCVQCNTLQWHDGLTCEQNRQRNQDSELHADQLRALVGDSAYQCGRCSFGPILHQYCYDLRTHHNEAVGATRINNACPRCGWFAADINQWPRWNGEMPTAQPQPAQ